MACQMNAEHILHDVIDIAIKHADLKDLPTMAKVCTSWKEAMERDKPKRFYLHLHLRYNAKNLTSNLNVNPCVLMFIQDTMSIRKSFAWAPLKVKKSKSYVGEINELDELEFSWLAHLKKQLPNMKMAFKDEKYLTSDFRPLDYDLLGLFFPDVKKKTRVRVGCIQSLVLPNSEEKMESFAAQLGLNDDNIERSTILAFADVAKLRLSEEILSRLEQRILNGGSETGKDKQVTFACLYGEDIIVDNGSDEYQSPDQYLVALRITGPSVDSWTAIIPRHSTFEEIFLELHELRKKIKPRRHYLGLIHSIHCDDKCLVHAVNPCSDYNKIMRIMKQIPQDFFYNVVEQYNQLGD